MTMTEEAVRVVSRVLDDGTTETRVYLDGKLVEVRHTPALDAKPYGTDMLAWLPDESV